MKKLSLELLKSRLHYDPNSGIFTWKITKGRCIKGMPAGNKNSKYSCMSVDGVAATTAQWAWFYTHGVWPETYLYHINGDQRDDRICNLALQKRDHKEKLTQEALKTLVSYDKDTGKFLYKTEAGRWSHRIKQGGALNGCGYLMININGKLIRAHRLAWFYVYGVWPSEEIDHINGDPADNRICNLREATRIENMANSRKPKTNTSGYKGVSSKHGRWQAEIKHNNKWYYLGLHDTPEAAHKAYCTKAVELKGDFARFE